MKPTTTKRRNKTPQILQIDSEWAGNLHRKRTPIYLLHLWNITSKDCTGSYGTWQPVFANRKMGDRFTIKSISLNCLDAQKPHSRFRIFFFVNGRAPVSWSLGEMDLQISFISFSHLCAPLRRRSYTLSAFRLILFNDSHYDVAINHLICMYLCLVNSPNIGLAITIYDIEIVWGRS